MQYLKYCLKYVAVGLLFGNIGWAAPVITVASPRAGTVGTPTYFDATASTASCAAGIAAMRIYTAPGVNAFTTNSPHLETFLTLKPGTYNTVIQAWDNCGGVSKVPVSISVSGSAGVHVFLPVSASNTTPAHFAVSAENSACAGGISAVRIYSAAGVNAFTSSGATLDAFIPLLPGMYSTVAQAWDNCGHVFKTPVSVTSVGGPNGKFLYAAETNSQVSEFLLNAGVVSNANASFSLSAAPNSVAVDPAGNFIYAGLSTGQTVVLDVNRANGHLSVKGTTSAVGSGPATVSIHPSGDFLYVAEQGADVVATYRVNRSDGTLTLLNKAPTGSAPFALNTDFNGRFLYVSNFNSHDVSGYAINTTSGALTQVSGSPFMTGTQPITLSGTAKTMFVNANDMLYSMNIGSGGTLTQASGSPFIESEMTNQPNTFMVDPIHNLLIYSGIGFSSGTDRMWAVTIGSNGTLGSGNPGGTVDSPGVMVLDPSFKYVYVEEAAGIASLSYTASGFANLSGPVASGGSVVQLGVAP